jgi:hypothetical protein
MNRKKLYYKPIKYTPEQLHKRQLNLQSQLLFSEFLDTDIINSLVDLFIDNKNTTPKIVKYIEDERAILSFIHKSHYIKQTHVRIYDGKDGVVFPHNCLLGLHQRTQVIDDVLAYK